jgi:U3 small nucleolar RNA-associated protein 10
MASLAEQLKRLAQGTPGAQGAQGARGGVRAVSLMFTDKEAAELDMDAVCAIGSNGLEQLLNLAPTFAAYAGLFGAAAREVNRDLQTKDANAKLDAHIRSFLRHLAPFLTVSAAHKALEWLIRRFNIHVHNVDAILECFLPYHHTNLFARMLKLVDVDGSPRWAFLTSSKKSGAPLDRQLLVTRCAQDRQLFAFACQLAPLALADPNPPVSVGHLVSLFVTVASGVLESTTVADALIAQLLPIIADSCRSPNTQLRAGTYVVLAQLSQNTALAPHVVSALLDAVL